MRKVLFLAITVIAMSFVACEDCDNVGAIHTSTKIYDYTFYYKVYKTTYGLRISDFKVSSIKHSQYIEEVNITDCYPLSFEDIEYYRNISS